MAVQKVEQNKSCLGHGVKSAAIGAGMGWAAQYALPLTTQEMDSDYRAVIKHIKEQTIKSRKESRDFIKSLRNNKLNQPALDIYVRSVKNNTRNSIMQYHWDMKVARGAAPFVVAGAVIGLVTSFVHNVFKTDVN